MSMITDKILEGVFNPASKYFTACRVACFLFAIFVQTKSFELISDGQILNMAAQDAAAKFIGLMSSVPVIFLVLYAFIAFWAGPKIHSLLCLLIVRFELGRVSERYIEVSRIVKSSSLSSLVADYGDIREKAIQGEKKIIGLLNYGETLVFFVIFGLFAINYDGLSLILYMVFVIPVPFLLHQLVASVLSEYLRSILYYKVVVERMQSKQV